ncbi:PepSY domain-containing protein [Jeongeupia chitinilytica]|uniref:PepSY domain-containing protein n=1 Tax=Jeongeupia chitinilytica TaxID=1041641 RepID=A0ABQ3GY37_9NEIS|nr:PepSY domain-containing protein [Jeongeupia chitinilytica]GHD58074.1 hypothetical protein GCM10007350_07390 [Jeongeupia chitinilytica]
MNDKGMPSRWRRWHMWAGVILALPFLAICVTALLISHSKSLELKKIDASSRWLPGYVPERVEAKALLQLADGTLVVGGKHGLWEIRAGRAEPALTGKRIEVFQFVNAPQGVFAATSSGLYRRDASAWTKQLAGNVTTVAVLADGSLIAGEAGKLQRSTDGEHWQADATVAAALDSLPKVDPPLSLARLLFDIHTGKALLGQDGKWLWIDACALVMLMLTLSGSWLWMRGRQRRVRLAVAGA